MTTPLDLGEKTVKWPRWAVDGVQLRIKATPELRRIGLRLQVQPGGDPGDWRGVSGELGTLRVSEWQGNTLRVVEFERGRSKTLHAPEDLADFVQQKGKRSCPPPR